MQNNKPAIVVIAYNRAKSLQRLLNTLSKAYYTDSEIQLIISIDKASDNQKVLEIAQDFKWNFGDKKVDYQTKNLGLRKHVIKCASLVNEYGSVILLEDDLFISPQFYNYSCQALNFSENKKSIGGVSLYNHQFNVAAKRNFSPIEDGYDNWYFQFASSWGQAWTKEQWNTFMNWYDKNQNLTLNPNIPKNVTNWSEKSWLKYFIHYLVEKDKFFIYPKVSLSTNFNDAGTHINKESSMYQVSLDYSKEKKYNFSEIENSLSTYDAFFENNTIHKKLNIKKEHLCVDLYGTKDIEKIKKKFILSSRIYDFDILKSFGRLMKPIDSNIWNNVSGEDIFLYDTSKPKKNTNKDNFYKEMFYSIKHLSRHDARKLFITLYWQRISKIFK